MNKNKLKGFTLIEVLIVIGIIAILATVVIIAINPARQFAQARDTQRISNANAILNAIGQRIADNKGVFEGALVVGTTTYMCGVLPSSDTAIAWTMAADTTTATGSLGCLIPTYLPEGLNEPRPGAAAYTVSFSNGRVAVKAPGAEINTPIVVSR